MNQPFRCFIATLVFISLPFFIKAQEQKLTEDFIWSGKLSAKRASGFRSMKDGEHYTNTCDLANGKAIVRYDFKEGKAIDTILKPEQLTVNGKPLQFGNYQLSDDENNILLSVDEEMIYRHSSKADYYVFNRRSGRVLPITKSVKVMYCGFSPDGRQLSYVKENNLYIFDVATEKETAVTNDGSKNAIINGATDWVYEEEFSIDVAFAWSPDSKKIAYYKFDESAVKEYNLTTYGELYPKEEKYKYPKAGETNSKVEIYVYDIASAKNVKMNTGTDREYLPRMLWTRNPNQLSIQRSNRYQNILELLLCDAHSGTSTVVLKESNNSFLEVTNDLFFLKDEKQFIWTSTRDGYNHIYLYGIDGKMKQQITKGNWDVTSYYGYDEKNSVFYYQSAELHASEREIWSTTLTGKKKLLTPQRGVHKAVFSSSFNYFIDTYSWYGHPYICSVNDQSGRELRRLEENKNLTDALDKYHLSKVDTFSFATTDGISLNGWMIKPVDFDPHKKYPVLLYVYGGPGRQTVMNEWGESNYFFHELLAQKGYIVVSVDNRGTAGRGQQFLDCIYGDMGKLEVKDQLSTANYLKQQSWVDGSRIGVWGWSFGGYMSSLLMTRSNGLFKTGIAVAPVTNWRYYDDIYTERYLKTPQENAKGYDENSPITYAKDLQGNFLLVHGSGDDNVHVQNSMDFINALVKANKPFDLMIYPNRTHGISGGGARLHLYTKMEKFILDNL